MGEPVSIDDMSFPMNLAVIAMGLGLGAAFTSMSLLLRLSRGQGFAFTAACLVGQSWALVWVLQSTTQDLDRDVQEYAMAVWALQMPETTASAVREAVIGGNPVTVSTRRDGALMNVTFDVEGGVLAAYVADPGIRQR